MSNLLEQAIVDAAALREVAIKSAEAALIEKYSKEFKDSVQKLLEQEETPAVDPAIAAPTPEMDMSAPAGDEKEKAFQNVASSFLEGDENEVITIDFDQLKKQIGGALGMSSTSPMLATPPVAPEATAPLAEGKLEESWGEEETQEMEEELELEEKELDEMYDTGLKQDVAKDALAEEELEEKLVIKIGGSGEEQEEYEFEESELEEAGVNPASAAKQLGVATKAYWDEEAKSREEEMREKEAQKKAAEEAAKTATKPTGLEENVELTLEELQELEEALKVDMIPDHQLRGYMGTTVVEKTLADNVEKAAARDDEATAKRKEEEEAMADLKGKLEESTKQNTDLLEKLSEMEENLVSLKENLEKLSVSNAKLLYTNKTLGNNSLNERQKSQIVENISKATTVLEAKTIYNTLQSAVEGAQKSKPKESLSEAIIRGNSSPFLTRKQPNADPSFTDRMKILAGISKKD